MPRVTHVKAARQDNRVCLKGQSYYWWKFRYGGKQMSLTYPRPSMLCSGRKSEVMGAQEGLEDDLNGIEDSEAGEAACESCAETFRDLGQQYEESADAMPESLQYGEQAENMREMGQSLEMQADELDNVDWDSAQFNDDEPDESDFEKGYDDDNENYEMAMDEWNTDKQYAEDALADAIDEAIEAAGGVEFLF